MSDQSTANNACWVIATSLGSCPAPNNALAGKVTFGEMQQRARSLAAKGIPNNKPCQQQLTISFFFDGTGNNKDIDASLNKSSNVARLYESHEQKTPLNVIRIYIPGVGTSFPEIGDRGGVMGMAFGKGGEGRIQYAMDRLDYYLTKAEARAFNPTNKIIGIHIAIFGFSRGSAEARAFAIRLHARLQHTGTAWEMQGKHYPVRIYFMGLFDTVAAVGVSNAARRSERAQIGVTMVGGAIAGSVWVNSESAKGHNDWASELRIPSSVLRCVHYVAAHEVRQSFPLDTVRVCAVNDQAQAAWYPANCIETVYPGMHADVGGGYAPGQEGRTQEVDEQLSQIPLLHMYREAINAGVPMLRVDQMLESVRPLFQLSATLAQRFDHYMSKASTSASVETQAAKHLYWLYRWRKLRASPGVDPYQVALANEREVTRRKASALQMQNGVRRVDGSMEPAPSPQILQQQRAARAQEIAALEEYADYTQTLSSQISQEDQRFLQKCWDVYVKFKHNRPLTLNEQMLLAAYQEPPLADPDLIAFFDHHVHDSVAGFRAGGPGYADTSTVGEPRDVFQGRGPWLALQRAG